MDELTMTHASRRNLPECFISLPGQRAPDPTLFDALYMESPEDIVAQLHVSADDLRRWKRLGWLDGIHLRATEFSPQQMEELEFIRDLARHGFPDAVVTRLLAVWPSPRYVPEGCGSLATHAVYSLRHGWVVPRYLTCPEPEDDDEDDDISFERIRDNLDRLDADELCELRGMIDELLDDGEAD